MDTTYKGEFSGFVDFYNNVTTSDAKEQYDANVEGEAIQKGVVKLRGKGLVVPGDKLIVAHGVGIHRVKLGPEGLKAGVDQNTVVEATDLQLHRLKELYKQIYAKSGCNQ